MNPILMIGAIIVTLALMFYSIGIISEQRKRKITRKVIIFISLGLLSDITATACMIIGSSNSPFTFHGLIGYTGLLAMLIETVLAYRFYVKNSPNTKVPKALHTYSLISYSLWVAVYITGTLLVVLK